MKKQLTVALGLAVLATPAFASKARLQALGEDTNGSFYINDNRNIFLNSAQVNTHKDLVTFETGDTSESIDNASTPRSEGGFFTAKGNMVYGVHLGSESATSNALRTWADASNEQNMLDVFVGGDAGMKWGANLSYSNVAEGGTIDNDKVMRTRLGVAQDNWDAFANVSLMNESQDENGADFKGKMGYQVGGSYMMNDYKLFAEYRSIKAEDKQASADAEIGLWRIGAGRTSKLNDKATLFTKLEVNRTTLNLETATGSLNGPNVNTYDGLPLTTGGEDLVITDVPLTIGMEVDAASWLTVRGSVSQSLVSDVSLKATSNENLEDTTIVNLGATLKFGELSVDGVIGNNDGTTVDADGTSSGTIRTDSLMSRVSMTYKF